MATFLPVQINNLRFSVNPTHLNITKGVNFGTLPTQDGVKYQVWYDAPEILTIAGTSAGKTAYIELSFLKRNFERTNKLSELFYKTRIYKGFITNLQVEHSTTHINQFTYSITFQLVFGEKFAIEDFTVTSKEIGGRIGRYINEPLNKFQSNIESFIQKNRLL